MNDINASTLLAVGYATDDPVLFLRKRTQRLGIRKSFSQIVKEIKLHGLYPMFLHTLELEAVVGLLEFVYVKEKITLIRCDFTVFVLQKILHFTNGIGIK